MPYLRNGTPFAYIDATQADDYAAIPSLDPDGGVPGDDAFPLYSHRDIPSTRTVRLHNLYGATRSLDDVAASVSMSVGELGPRLKSSGEWDGEGGLEVLVNMPCTHFALDASRCVDRVSRRRMAHLHTLLEAVAHHILLSRSALPELQHVAHLLYFPLSLVTLAEEAITTLHSLMSALPSSERLGRARRRHPRYNGIAVMGYDDYRAFTGDHAADEAAAGQWAAYERALLAELAASGAPCFIGFEDLQVVDQGTRGRDKHCTHPYPLFPPQDGTV